jgi:prenylcysteine oxidase/farnesylcysteine lyase
MRPDSIRQRVYQTSRARLLIFSILFLSITALLCRSFRSSPASRFFEFEDDQLEYPASSHDGAVSQLRPRRIAIVGAGASGSATAFFLRRAARVMAERIGVAEERLVGDIVVFDKEGYIGGRGSRQGCVESTG